MVVPHGHFMWCCSGMRRGQPLTRVEDMVSGQAGTLVSASHIVLSLLRLPGSLVCPRSVPLFSSQAACPGAWRDCSRAATTDPGQLGFCSTRGVPSAPVSPAFLVCLDEKVGNVPKHPIVPGLIFALCTVSRPVFQNVCL